MVWRITFLPQVKQDLRELGTTETRAVRKVIEKRMINGEPDKAGKLLSGDLSGCRRIRTGQSRIVYRVKHEVIEVVIIAIGLRRKDEVYEKAAERIN